MRINRTTTIVHPYCTETHVTTTYVTLATIASAVWAFIKRCGRVLHAVITVSKRHAPKWLAVVLGIALAIPGPIDELIVLSIIGVMVAIKPIMRADMVASVRTAWMPVL